MCRFELETCPFPHHDPISALIFLPGRASLWKQCDLPKPWGRLSCGKLTIQHHTSSTTPAQALAPDCKWCTAVLKLVGTKSKEIQQKAQTEITELEDKLRADAELTRILQEMETLELQLSRLRALFWDRRLIKGIDGGEWEEVKAED